MNNDYDDDFVTGPSSSISKPIVSAPVNTTMPVVNTTMPISTAMPINTMPINTAMPVNATTVTSNNDIISKPIVPKNKPTQSHSVEQNRTLSVSGWI